MSEEMKKVKRKDAKQAVTEKESETIEDDEKKTEKNGSVEPKFGPVPTFPHQRVWSRCILIIGVLIVVWYNSRNVKEVSLAFQKDVLLNRKQALKCSDDYKTAAKDYPDCAPENCARVVTDKLVTDTESDVLLRIATSGLKLGGSDGGASILDLHSGALSKGTGFVDVYSLQGARDIFNAIDLSIYKAVRMKIQATVALNFGVDSDSMYLTHPTFFSRLTNTTAKTIHDEYWHPHVDKETYKSFYYTSLIYLNDFGKDFQGGRFIFVDNTTHMTVEPRKGKIHRTNYTAFANGMNMKMIPGRVSMFTSGTENLHFVERVTSGTRYAMTVSFTCDPEFAIPDPAFGASKRHQ